MIIMIMLLNDHDYSKDNGNIISYYNRGICYHIINNHLMKNQSVHPSIHLFMHMM
jgi:hypothetical protein